MYAYFGNFEDQFWKLLWKMIWKTIFAQAQKLNKIKHKSKESTIFKHIIKTTPWITYKMYKKAKDPRYVLKSRNITKIKKSHNIPLELKCSHACKTWIFEKKISHNENQACNTQQ